MARNVSDGGSERTRSDGADSPAGELDSNDGGARRSALGRRMLLTRGGVVAAGVVGASAVAAVAAGSASAASGDPVLQGTVNNAGTSTTPTELDADNATAPAFILNNTGVDTTNTGAGPSLRLTTAAGAQNGPLEPTASTVGGDLTATADGLLWFTHDLLTESSSGVFTQQVTPAPVHTEATANVYAGLPAPLRVLDTRTASLRTNIINPSGNLSSSSQLLGGKTIYINLDGLVAFADNVLANITVTGTATSGYLTVWSGEGTRPNASAVTWTGANVTVANFLSSSVGSYPAGSTTPTDTNVIAIYAAQTTHVILDVCAFTMPGFEYATGFAPQVTSKTRNARMQHARKIIAAKRTRASKRA